MSKKHEYDEPARHLIHRDQLDDLNEHYVQHHIEHAVAKVGWVAALFYWMVPFGAAYFFVGDVFFPKDYYIYAYIAVAIISGMMVGFDRGVRIK